ncbi:MAG: NUDIX hydrolase [Alphaproteobacteria bacterium]|jgi:ADP-ribose pyrophosphatase YjhB (NUDIX family)|nr:NUDIX hydrolase [Alphaproteobacteria bacterium]MDP6815582.1 NUDIX hydrolase [Alphaproteobacteria bacterium]
MPRSYPDRPMVGVGAVVFKGRQVLLIRRGKQPRLGEWSLPGGLQELGETVFEAAAREIMEETAVTIGDIGVIDIVDSIQHDDAGRVRFHYTLIDVVAEWRGGEPTAGTDAMHAEWIAPERLDAMDLWSETRRIIAEARRMRGR